MASPPHQNATSSPNPSPLALPRQRPTLALPGQHGRKASITSATSGSHPLRQTSFPPQDRQQSSGRHAPAFSPEDSLDDVSDGEINSVISAPIGEDGNSRKRKRGEKRTRGRQSKISGGRARSSSLVNGDDGRSSGKRTTAPSVAAPGDDADAEEDDEEEEEDAGATGGRLPLYEGGQMTADEVSEERERKRVFYESVPEPHRDRSEAYYRAKLRTADVRRLVNQTLSQSVPQNVVLVVASYTKLFAGMLIEEARAVQAEWLATDPKRPDEKTNDAFRRLPTAEASAMRNEHVDSVPASATTNDSTVSDEETSHQVNTTDVPAEDAIVKPIVGGAGGLLQDINECDRGPLLPDHLREALRRYKKSRRGGPVGFTGLSLEGRDVAAPRMGGKKLFR